MAAAWGTTLLSALWFGLNAVQVICWRDRVLLNVWQFPMPWHNGTTPYPAVSVNTDAGKSRMQNILFVSSFSYYFIWLIQSSPPSPLDAWWYVKSCYYTNVGCLLSLEAILWDSGKWNTRLMYYKYYTIDTWHTSMLNTVVAEALLHISRFVNALSIVGRLYKMCYVQVDVRFSGHNLRILVEYVLHPDVTSRKCTKD